MEEEATGIMKVMFLIGQLGLGGGERQLYLLLKGLDKTKVTPVVICFNKAENYWGPFISDMGISVHYLLKKGVLNRIIYILKLLKTINPHIGISWDIQTNPYLSIVAQLYKFRRSFGGVRCNLFRPGRSPFQRWISTVGISNFIVNSSQGFRDTSLLRKKAMVYLFPNSFESVKSSALKMDQTLRSRFTISDDSPIVLFVGGLKPVKNPLLLLEVFLDVTKEFSCHLIFIGEGTLKDKLIMVASQSLFGDRVHFTGVLPDAFHYMADADLLALTSTTEGMPGVLLEGAFAGLPLLATNVGGVEDIIIDGYNGFVVPVNSREILTQRLRELISNPSLRKKMGENSKKRVEEKFTNEQMILNFEKIIGA